MQFLRCYTLVSQIKFNHMSLEAQVHWEHKGQHLSFVECNYRAEKSEHYHNLDNIHSYQFICSINLQDLPPERAFADFVLCNLVLHLVIMNFLGQIAIYGRSVMLFLGLLLDLAIKQLLPLLDFAIDAAIFLRCNLWSSLYMKEGPAIEFSMICFLFEKPHSLLKNQTPKQSFVGMQHSWFLRLINLVTKFFTTGALYM